MTENQMLQDRIEGLHGVSIKTKYDRIKYIYIICVIILIKTIMYCAQNTNKYMDDLASNIILRIKNVQKKKKKV